MKKTIFIILILICCKHFGFAQLYPKDQPRLLYKYKIQKYTMTCNDYVDSVFISIKSLPQSDKIEIQYLKYIIPTDSSLYLAMYNSYDIRTETYDKEWNIIKETYQSVYDSIPSIKKVFFYNDNNQIIQKKLFDTHFNDPKYVHKDSLYGDYEFSVNELYFYKDSLLTKYTFRSESDSVIYEYYYDDCNRLYKMVKTDKNLNLDTTSFYYKSDTTVSIRYDSLGIENYNYKTIKDEKGRVTDMYRWQKGKQGQKIEINYGVKSYFDERGLIIRNETYSNNEEEVIDICKFSFER